MLLKKIFRALLCTLLFLPEADMLKAQGLKPPVFVYADAGFGAGSIFQLNAELNCLFLDHHLISIGYSGYSRNSDVPSDYDGSGLFGTTTPLEYLDGLAINYGYVLYPKNHARNDRLRFTIKAGALIGTYSRPGNFHKNNSWFGPNYNYDDIAEPTVAFTIRPGITYAPSRAFGLNGGVYVVVGRLSGIGVWGSMSLGKVGSHVRQRGHKRKAH